jgi:hypothetical protein
VTTFRIVGILTADNAAPTTEQIASFMHQGDAAFDDGAPLIQSVGYDPKTLTFTVLFDDRVIR